MAASSENPQPPVSDEPTTTEGLVSNRIIKRFGGRHLIFRTQVKGAGVWPRPYGLVSTFRGPVWFFYGVGQVWITHRKYQAYDGWLSRIPRFGGIRIKNLLDAMQPQITEFTHHCNEQGVEGTLVIEPQRIEFHWTFGYPLEQEKLKQENSEMLDDRFHQLVEAFLEVTTG